MVGAYKVLIERRYLLGGEGEGQLFFWCRFSRWLRCLSYYIPGRIRLSGFHAKLIVLQFSWDRLHRPENRLHLSELATSIHKDCVSTDKSEYDSPECLSTDLPNLYSRNQDFVSCFVGDCFLKVVDEFACRDIYLYDFLFPCDCAPYELLHCENRQS